MPLHSFTANAVRVATLGALAGAFPSSATARPLPGVPGLQCSDDLTSPESSDCFREEVFIVDGAARVGGKPIVICTEKRDAMGATVLDECAPGLDCTTGQDPCQADEGCNLQTKGCYLTCPEDPLNPAPMSTWKYELCGDCRREEVRLACEARGFACEKNAVTKKILNAAGQEVETKEGRCWRKPVRAALDSYDCAFDAELAVRHMLEVLDRKGVAPSTWDQMVVFGIDISPPDRGHPPGPLLYPVAGSNDVGNIGLGPRRERDPAQPHYAAIIHAGSTVQIQRGARFGQGTMGITNPGSNNIKYENCGILPQRPGIEAPAEQPRPALCAPAFYNFFDALAQTTASQFGPYLVSGRSVTPGEDLSVWPEIKTNLVDEQGQPRPQLGRIASPRIWNSMLDLGGSLLGGNTFRDNGNGTWETTLPTPFVGVSAPKGGTQALRFQPIDLYLLGLLPKEEVRPIATFWGATYRDILHPFGVRNLDKNVGARMGARTSVAVRSDVRGTLDFGDIVAANGEREPGYDRANHFLRQLWLAVRKPRHMLEPLTGVNRCSPGVQTQIVADYGAMIDPILAWRRAWNAYFYTLTQYRGRMITTFDGAVDDLPYWEFGHPADDARAFEGEGGLTMELRGREEAPGAATDGQTVMRIDTPGEGGRIRFKNHPLPIRITGSQAVGAPWNAISVRLMIPAGAAAPDAQLFALLTLDGGPELRIPGENASFIADGKFRTYSANLSKNAAFTGGDPDAAPTYAGFTFQPSNLRVEGMQLDFIRFGSVAAPLDSDKDCDRSTPKPDGFIDSEDNCPGYYNPDQADENQNGVGDACEDYDADTIANVCDPCPTVTGDCRPRDGGCFLMPDAVAGRLEPAAPGALVCAVLIGVAGAVRVGRRRRRGPAHR